MNNTEYTQMKKHNKCWLLIDNKTGLVVKKSIFKFSGIKEKYKSNISILSNVKAR